MRLAFLIALLAASLLPGCASVPLTRDQVMLYATADNHGEESLRRWQEAVSICNGFLHSSFRKTLPSGEIRFTDDGMEFVSPPSVQPCRVRCTTWGDLLVHFGYSAQERSDGFVVGRVGPIRDRRFGNSFFLNSDGTPLSNVAIAGMILHELTHSYYHVGMVAFGVGFRYYAESILLLRYRHHSMERLPFETSGEFESFVQANIDQQANRSP